MSGDRVSRNAAFHNFDGLLLCIGMRHVYSKQQLEKVAKKFRLRFVILHGSYAAGRPRPDSDFDVAVLGEKELGAKQFLDLYAALDEILCAKMSCELDMKALHRVDPFFRYEVVRVGKLLYGNLTDYEEFKAFAHRAFEDAQPLLELERVLARKYQKHLRAIAKQYA